MIYNVFDTEQEAIEAVKKDWDKFKKDKSYLSIKYYQYTRSWTKVTQRMDGKWVYPKYDESEESYTEETYDASWFLSDE